MHILNHRVPRIGALLLLAAVALTVVALPGCAGFMSHMAYVLKGGHAVPAEFEGLQAKRVAVVCVSNDSVYGPNSVSSILEHSVGTLLKQNVEDIDLIHREDVADWIDTHDWDQVNYREIGRGLNAEMVVAIDLDGFRLHEGRTLYKGRADITVAVYDMTKGGEVVFRKSSPEYSFPENGARHSTEISETRFKRMFLMVLAQHVGKYFYEYYLEDDFARDALVLEG